ncbi:VPLPA-CTERM sorting domain-containing protein [Hwanghaeella sp.]|uniref:VPLPA-CTERM sorting domain-containing protein n=1 Tax=Hwanghaeella sp. TaxID=2605943 RepID=UPI003CCC4413
MKFKAVLAALTLGAMASLPAQAAVVTPPLGFDLTLSGNTNVPTFTLVNTSAAGQQLTGFTFTIGNVSRHFDFVNSLSNPAGGTSTLNSPDSVDNGARSDTIDLTFTGFDAGESVSFAADVDLDPSFNSTQDYRNVFFNNGTALNSVATAFFAFGTSVSLTLPDNPVNQSSYSFSASNGVSAVPLPAALPLLVAGLAGLGILSRRRKTAA